MRLRSLNYTLLGQFEEESNFPSSRKRSTLRNTLKWGIPSLFGLALFIALVINHATRISDDFELGSGPACPQYPVINAQSGTRAELERSITIELTSDDFLSASVKRLQGAVKIPTESFDDMKLVGEDSRWDAFVDFHTYLEETFPLV
jgi:Gly-Xaa carboxypeptidase